MAYCYHISPLFGQEVCLCAYYYHIFLLLLLVDKDLFSCETLHLYNILTFPVGKWVSDKIPLSFDKTWTTHFS